MCTYTAGSRFALGGTRALDHLSKVVRLVVLCVVGG